MEKVILVTDSDEPIGEMEKMDAHLKGRLHRAISVFIFNSKGELLLQKRAEHKYHSGGLWTNTCCSHPRPGEETLAAAKRRLDEEMGMEAEIKHSFSFKYKAHLDNELIEHEFDHVFTGITDVTPIINPEEVSDYTYLNIEDIQREIEDKPNNYTEWFKIIFNEYLKELKPIV